jgi:hypothetical protein
VLKGPSIDAILVLSRRPLDPTLSDKKLELVVVEDFSNYEGDVVEKFRDVDCCIW